MEEKGTPDGNVNLAFAEFFGYNLGLAKMQTELPLYKMAL